MMTAMEGPPNHPKSFGEELRRLRESAGLDLADIAVETKISKGILAGLEAGDFRFLPEKVFCRNFVLQYAAVVGADPDRLAEAFDDAWERFLLASGSHPGLVASDEPPKRTINWRFWLPVGIGAAILWHTATNAAALYVQGTWGPVAAEGTLLLFTGVSAAILWVVHQREQAQRTGAAAGM